MSDTPTPRVNKWAYYAIPSRLNDAEPVVSLEDARQLERELTEAKAQATDFLKQWVESQAREVQLREALERINSQAHRIAKVYPPSELPLTGFYRDLLEDIGRLANAALSKAGDTDA